MIYLKLEPYLAQWLKFEYGEPISFPRNATENDIIEIGLIPLPKNTPPNLPEENTVAIQIPTFKYKEVRNNNFLPKKSQSALRRCIRSRFVIALWQDLHRFGHIGDLKQDIIWAWMESHGIELNETNFNTINKIYLRKREAYRKKIYRQKKT